MNNSIEMEILRLVKEIARDEMKVMSALDYNLPEQAQTYKDSIERKIKLLEILKK